jgi:hypothetical protein
MKKLLILVLVFEANLVSLNAQLKVDSNGNVGIGSSSSSFYSPLSINSSGDFKYAFSCSGVHGGIYCEAQGSALEGSAGRFVSLIDSGIRYGLIGDAHSAEGSLTSSYGIQGTAGNALLTNIGVYGALGNCTKGSGIYGTTSTTDSGTSLFFDNCKYAGYFNGTTKVIGDLIVTGNIQGVLLGKSTPNTNLLHDYASSRVTDLFSGIQASQFKIEGTQQQLGNLPDSLKDFVLDIQKENSIERQYLDKNHFALSADKLEEVFPDLVYENEDGSKGINYTEMIPLLVQSINELNIKITELEKGMPSLQKAPLTTDASSTAITQAVLYQNKPNPFSAQTDISFNIPYGSDDAFIYVFDMQGKMKKQIPVEANQQNVKINGYELQAGIYLYSLVVGGQEIDTKRMILSK